MDEFLSRALDQLLGRLQGVLHLRFLFQPCMAALLAIRAGVLDARAERPPYLWALCFHAGERRDLIREAWRDAGRVFILACVVDGVYQLVMLHWFYPVQMLIVAFVLAIIPYVLLRGPAARLTRLRDDAMRSRVKGAHP